MKSDDFDLDLIDRYLAGEATADELKRLEAWLMGDPSRARFLESVATALEPVPVAQWHTDVGWSRFQQRASDGPPATLNLVHEEKLSLRVLLKAAAIAAVLIGGYAVMRPGPEPAVTVVMAVTLTGQRDTVRLADGSTVILAPDSRLEVTLGDGMRTAVLDGEAYFTVAPDTAWPFRVLAGESVTEVVGTEFTVRSRSNEPVVVAVRTGRIAFGRATPAGVRIMLDPDEIGRLALAAEPERVSGQQVGAWLAWLDGVLEYDDARLDRVVADLGRWLGVGVSIDGADLAARRVTGRFATGSAEQLLDALCLALGLSWQRYGDAFLIRDSRRE